MALTQSRAGHADEARVALHLFDSSGADVAHRLAQPADELIDHVRQRPLVRHAPLDALGDQARLLADAALEVTVLAVAAALHGADGSHAAIVLVALALQDHQIAGTLIHSDQQPTQHHGVRARRDSLGDVARILDAAVGDDWDAAGACRARAVVDSGDLWHADPRHDTRCADRVMHDRIVRDETMCRAIHFNVVDRNSNVM